MEDKHTMLISVSYIVEITKDEPNFCNTLNKITRRLWRDKKFRIDNEDIALENIKISSLRLDYGGFNCGKCSKCGHWTTDRDKPDAIDGLPNGATVDGKLLCDECLPHDHKWAF